MTNYSQKMRQERLVFYEDDIEDINKILTDFLDASQAKCALLIDKEGHLVTKRGFTKAFDTDGIAALVAGSFASTRAVANMLGEQEFSQQLLQGKNEHIHVSLVSERALSVVVFDDRTTIGMVRLYAEELTNKISETLAKCEQRNAGRSTDVSQEFLDKAEGALDDFFGKA